MVIRTLIVPDVHQNIQPVQRLLRREAFDRLVVLGDWFDGGGDTRAAAVYLHGLLADPRFTAVLGNHDAQYFWPDVADLRCTGWSAGRMQIVAEVLDPPARFRRLFRLFTWADGWLLSHAGLTLDAVPEGPRRGGRALARWLDREAAAAVAALESGWVHPLLTAGVDRGGWQPWGGIDWADWDSFVPIPGLNQVAGHTPGRDPRWKEGPHSRNLCLDTGLRHYALIENGRINVHAMG